MTRRYRDRDIRRCGSCGGWTIIGRVCQTCSINVQVECEQGMRQRLDERFARQQAALREKRMRAWI